MAIFFSIAFTAIALFTATATFAADAWTLTTVDFRSQRISFESLDEKQIAFSVTNIGGGSVPLDRVLQVRREEPGKSSDRRAANTTTNSWIASLSNGDRIVGQPRSTSGETVVWSSPALGDVGLSMRQLRSIARATTTSENVAHKSQGRSSEPAVDDVVHLNNGDSVHGIINELTATAVAVQPAAGGDAASVPLESVSSIDFASAAAPVITPASDPSGSRTFRITLSDSSRIRCASPQFPKGGDRLILNDLTVQVSHEAGAPSIPIGSVVAIEQIDGPITWLSDLTPIENVQTSFLGLAWPARFDASVGGGAIRFEDHTFAHGIGVHSYSRLTFPIADSSVLAFRTQYAIDLAGSDGATSLADVTVRIKLDGKTAYEHEHVRGGALSPVVSLPLEHAKSITLEVDYGDNQDVQDRLNWIEPALLRFDPKATPTTQAK